MMKHLKTIITSKKFMAKALLLSAVVLAAPLAAAQEADVEPSGALVPNLTVNIKLNSALGEKETEFYSKIAQDLISKLPRQLSVDKQADALKDLDDAYKHLNVVTYLPPTDDIDTDKLIKHFKVRFVFDDQEGAKTADEAKDIVLPKALQDEKNDETIVGLKTPDTGETTQGEVPDNSSMMDRMLKQEQTSVPVSSLPTVQPEPALIPAPAPAPAPVQPAVKPRPAPTVVAAVTPKPTPKARTSAAPKTKVNKLRLDFDTDETILNVPQRVETMKFIQKLRSNYTKQPDGFVFVVRSYEGPIGVEDNLGESRLRSVTALLRQQDINVSRSRVTEIFVRTDGQQFIEVEPVY